MDGSSIGEGILVAVILLDSLSVLLERGIIVLLVEKSIALELDLL